MVGKKYSQLRRLVTAIFVQFGTCENPGYFYPGRIQDLLRLGVLNRESPNNIYILATTEGGVAL